MCGKMAGWVSPLESPAEIPHVPRGNFLGFPAAKKEPLALCNPTSQPGECKSGSAHAKRKRARVVVVEGGEREQVR